MDITLAKTFIAVAEQGSFVDAAEHLHVTQSTVSTRIKTLETLLGHAVFKRSKAECVPTAAGMRFDRYARSLVRVWEEARQQVSIPEGFERSLSIGSQHGLWQCLLIPWLPELRAAHPQIAIRAQVAAGQHLLSGLQEGVLDFAVMYQRHAANGVQVEKLVEDELLLVTTDPAGHYADRYVLLDWGEEFRIFHAQHHAHLKTDGLSLSIGSLGIEFLLRHQRAGYVPHVVAAAHIASGALRVVSSAPRLPYPAYIAWRQDYADSALMASVATSLRSSALALLRSVVGERRQHARP